MYVQRVQQIGESHCGPAVIEMLLAVHGVYTSQHEIASKGGAEKNIDELGTRPDQLGLAVSKIAPHLQFWYKEFSSLEDIEYLLNKNIPVGVEWQGLFYDSEEEEPPEREGDFGHYCIITYLDRELDNIVVVDPYKDFPQQRFFSLEFFMRRWYDQNPVADPLTGQTLMVQDTRLLFFLTPLEIGLDPEHKFKRFSKSTLEHWFQMARKKKYQ